MSDEHAEPPRTDQVSDYEDRSISCIDCGEDFIWTVGEQEFFHDKGLQNEPKRCKPCKQRTIALPQSRPRNPRALNKKSK